MCKEKRGSKQEVSLGGTFQNGMSQFYRAYFDNKVSLLNLGVES